MTSYLPRRGFHPLDGRVEFTWRDAIDPAELGLQGGEVGCCAEGGVALVCELGVSVMNLVKTMTAGVK